MYGMDNVYNVDLKKRTCVAHVNIANHLPVEDFITQVRSAAKGLTDAWIEARADVEYGDPVAEIVVSGTRPLTDKEYDTIVAAEEKHRRYRAHMAKFEG